MTTVRRRTKRPSSRTLASDVFERLRGDILACRLAPGTRLRFKDLAGPIRGRPQSAPRGADAAGRRRSRHPRGSQGLSRRARLAGRARGSRHDLVRARGAGHQAVDQERRRPLGGQHQGPVSRAVEASHADGAGPARSRLGAAKHGVSRVALRRVRVAVADALLPGLVRALFALSPAVGPASDAQAEHREGARSAVPRGAQARHVRRPDRAAQTPDDDHPGFAGRLERERERSHVSPQRRGVAEMFFKRLPCVSATLR